MPFCGLDCPSPEPHDSLPHFRNKDLIISQSWKIIKKMHQSKSIQTAKLVCLQKCFKKKTTSVTWSKVLYRNISCFAKKSKGFLFCVCMCFVFFCLFVWFFAVFFFCLLVFVCIFFNDFPMVGEQKTNNFFSLLKQKITFFHFKPSHWTREYFCLAGSPHSFGCHCNI